MRKRFGDDLGAVAQANLALRWQSRFGNRIERTIGNGSDHHASKRDGCMSFDGFCMHQ